MFGWVHVGLVAALALALGCGDASGGGGGRGDGPFADGSGGTTGIPGTGATGAPVAQGYFDIDGNPVTTVYDASGNPVTPGAYTGALYDGNGEQVYDGNGVPASSTGGTSGPLDLDNCAADGAEAEVGLQGADIIWVVDNSCSMAVEAAAVQANMNSFMTSLIDRGIDARVVLISSSNQDTSMQVMCAPSDFVCNLMNLGGGFDYGVCIAAPFGSGMCPDDSNPPNFQHLNQSVGSRNALQMAVDLYPQYAATLRPNAVKHFAVITDDESDMAAADFTARVNALDPVMFSEWVFHAIYSKTQCPDAARVGTVYDQLVTQTMGVSGDLCLQQFDPVFQAMAVDVAEKADIACDWPIPEPPDGQFLDLNKVNVEYTTPDGTTVGLARIPDGEDCGGREGWSYDDPANPTKVVSCPTSCDGFQDTGGRVDVLFGCDSVLVE